jgi:hypothetical protein
LGDRAGNFAHLTAEFRYLALRHIQLNTSFFDVALSLYLGI